MNYFNDDADKAEDDEVEVGENSRKTKKTKRQET